MDKLNSTITMVRAHRGRGRGGRERGRGGGGEEGREGGGGKEEIRNIQWMGRVLEEGIISGVSYA